MFTNAQSLPGKINELEAVLIDLRPDIVLLSETWCNTNITNEFLNVSGYTFQTDLRMDRTDTANGIGGGLAIYTVNGLNILACDQVSDFNQYCKFKIERAGEVVYFYLMYRPPSGGQISKEQISELFRLAEKKSVFIGDFNLPDIDWVSGTATSKSSSEVLAAANAAGLVQMVNFPTHTRGNTLDLILTNIPERVENVADAGRLGRSDHVIVTCEVNMLRHVGETVKLKNWNRADWDAIKRGIRDTTWPATWDSTSAEAAWQLLRGRLDQLVGQHVPEREFKERSSDWMTKDILQLIRKKRRLWKKAKVGQNVAEYEEVARQVNNKVRTAKRQMEKKLARDRTGNKKPFYNYVRKKTRGKLGVGPLEAEGSSVQDPEKMAEVLNQAFSEVFTREDCSQIPRPKQHATRTSLTNTFITTQKVRAQIKKLKATGAAGPDGITTRLLQTCQEELSPVLATIYRKSLNEGTVPREWKLANVVPIFKKGSKKMASNYRPISLTCIACKVMESILKEDITEHLRRNKIISNTQHGFRKGRSCTTNLLEFMEVVTRAADEGKSVDIIYLDFAKAFDKVPIQRLIAKMSAAGLRGNVLKWISDWLVGRKQRVTVQGRFSTWRDVLSGVPQGSVLGPLLFSIYINDLDDVATRNQLLRKFADDTKIGQVLDSPASTQELQQTLDNLCGWADRWGMAFNVQKCHVMHVGRHNPRAAYTMNGTQLQVTHAERDVGVIISDDLKQAGQCKKAAQTASTVLGQIHRAFHYRDRHTYVSLYKQYVRPHLEFASPAWSPWNLGDVACLERVQERAIKAVSGLGGQTYTERLAELGLPSLEARRLEADMVQVYKALNDSDSGFGEQWFTKMENVRATRHTDGPQLRAARAGHNYRRGFFSVRTIEHWNDLPRPVKEAGNIAEFKRRYRDFQRIRVTRQDDRTAR
jgi:Reverse transcriptase (RNA-dependent DNA polymerase)/Endonuclease-reverse transcriptase